MAVYREGSATIVGHLPREIARLSFYFAKHDGRIKGEVTAKRRNGAQRQPHCTPSLRLCAPYLS